MCDVFKDLFFVVKEMGFDFDFKLVSDWVGVVVGGVVGVVVGVLFEFG